MKQLIINGMTIEVEKKRIKNMYLRILPPDGKIHISAPVRMSEVEIKKFVLSKQDWIKEHQSQMILRNEKKQINYVTGDWIPVWGRNYSLIVEENSLVNKVLISGENINLFLKKMSTGSSSDRREAVLNTWYRNELTDKLPELISKWESTIGVKSSGFTIRDMKTRWGTCNVRTKKICFNLQLAKKPLQCLEYVVVHELVHLLERSHNAVFKGYMTRFLPEWKNIKKELNEQKS
jgi:Predicted metal-dependent hydrolase